MNERLKNKLSEVVGANNISYILNDEKDFSVTGYKVMQNQGNVGLLRCAKIIYNGKIKLVYIVEGNKPLSYVATRLGVNELNAILFNLIQRVMDIKANGFFKVENLEFDFEKVFVDTSDYSIHLIYFPISSDLTGKMSGFENEFRIFLINLLNSFPVFSAPQFQRLCSDLVNGSMTLDVIMNRLKGSAANYDQNNYEYKIYDNGGLYQDYRNQNNMGGMRSDSSGDNHSYNNDESQNRNTIVDSCGYSNDNCVKNNVEYHNHNVISSSPNLFAENNSLNSDGASDYIYSNNAFRVQPILTLTAINSPVRLVITIDTPEYLIGKNPNMVNGAVTYNPAISRVHCKISYSQGKYYITDMGSANGTFLNQQKVDKQHTMEINNGDTLKLANSDFIISF